MNPNSNGPASFAADGFLVSQFSILYIASLFAISLLFARKAVRSYEEYSLCGRSLSFAYIIMTYFGTWVGGGTIIGLTGLAYVNGISNYWILSIPYLVSFPFAVLFMTRIRKLEQYNIGDMMALRFPAYGQVIRIPTAIAVVIRNITMIGMQFSAISFLVAYIFDINRNLAILLIFIVITSYTSLSGLWGIVGTDILQGILQAVGLLLLLSQSLKLSGGIQYTVEFFTSIDHADYLRLIDGQNWWSQVGIYICTIGLFFLMGDQGDWQKINSCKTDRIAFWGYLMPACAAMIWLLIPAYVGVFQRVIMPGGLAPDTATFQMILNMFSNPAGAFIIVCLLAAVTSSADSYLLATGTTFSKDIIKEFLIRDSNDKELIFWSRFFVVIAGGMGFAVAICIHNLINLWMAGLIINASIMLVPYLSAWFSKRLNTAGAIAGMIAGGMLCVLWMALKNPFGLHPIWVSILFNFAISRTVCFFTAPPSREDLYATYYWSPKFQGLKNIP